MLKILTCLAAVSLASFTLAPRASAQNAYPPPPPPQQQQQHPPAQQAYPPPAQQQPPQQGYPPPAQQQPPQQGYPPPAYPPQQPAAEPEPEFKPFAIEVNPLSLFIGRYSLNVEWLPAVHHGLIINPHYESVSADVTVSDPTSSSGSVTFEDHFSGGGVELGYRYYTGKKGPNGFFVGPSLLMAWYSASPSDYTGSEAKDFSSLGFAVDVGGQGVVGPGIVIGGGFGIQRTWVDGSDEYIGDLPLSAELLVGSGVRPRFMFSVGYAF